MIGATVATNLLAGRFRPSVAISNVTWFPRVRCARVSRLSGEHMDERRHTAAAERRREGSPARALAEQREQVKRFLNELSDATDGAERDLAENVHQLTLDLSAAASGRDDGHSTRLAERANQLERREAELATQVEDLTRRESDVAELRRRIEAERKQFEDDVRRSRAESEELQRQKARLDERTHRLESREEDLEAERQRTKSQRRRIAGELREQRDALDHERRRMTDELDSARDDLRRRTDDVRRRAAELDRREAHMADAGSASHVDGDLRDRLHRLEAQLAERNTALAEARAEVDDLRARLADYKAKVAEMEALVDQVDAGGDLAGEVETWKKRYEEAAEDLRDARRRNAVLEKSCGTAEHNSGDAMPMDWESQKKRLLAALQTDFDPRDKNDQADRLTIEGTIQITDNMIAERDREIAELQARLEAGGGTGESGHGLGVPQVDDEATARSRGEVERLRHEWEDKLRAAEIELSLERAKLARERTEFEDRRAEYESQLKNGGPDAPTAMSGDEPRRSSGGRWLARLGLREKNGE
jgi:DNA repair exonuclease SbcCD ATPase subunit